MAAAQSGKSGWVIGGRRLGSSSLGRENFPRHHRRAGGYGYTVEEIAAGDPAMHPKFAIVEFVMVVRIVHDFLCTEKRRLLLPVCFLHGQFGALESDFAVRSEEHTSELQSP